MKFPENRKVENIIFEAKNIVKSFPGILALDNVDIHLREKEIIGIAGENGAGKSTLLKIIAGIFRQDSGEMFLRSVKYSPNNYREASSLGVSMVFQEQALVPSIYVYENLFLSHENKFTVCGFLDKRRMIAEARSAIDGLNLDIDPTKLTWNYSFNERQMIEICKAFTVSKLLGIKMPIILLDEPTSGLSDQKIEILFNKIREYSDMASFMFISHRLSELMELCDRIYILKDGRSINVIDPRQSTETNLHEFMVGRKKDSFFYKEDLQLQNVGSRLLEVNDLSKERCFSNVSFDLSEREILGIGGVVGCGKHRLALCLAGLEGFNQGRIKVSGKSIKKPTLKKMMRFGLGYVPSDRKTEGIIGYLPVTWNLTLPSISNIKLWKFPLLNLKKEKELTRDYISKFSIKVARLNSLCFSLSGGNQQKVLLAKWVVKKLKVLILDNPTRGIDVGAKEEIYTILRDLTKNGLSVVLITDDLLELIGLSNRIIIMKDGIVTKECASIPDNKPSEKELVSYMV